MLKKIDWSDKWEMPFNIHKCQIRHLEIAARNVSKKYADYTKIWVLGICKMINFPSNVQWQ